MKTAKNKPLTKTNPPENNDFTDTQHLSPQLLEDFSHFAEYHPAQRLARNLRNLLIEFLMFDGAIEAAYLQDLLYDLQGLFELLESIQSEMAEPIEEET